MSEKRPETDREILSRSQRFELSFSKESLLRAVKPKKYSPDLAAHMAECDINYHKLHKLFGEMRSRKTKTISLGFMDQIVKVRIRVLDRGPYTTTVSINQIKRDANWNFIPSISVRIYHDAKSAEVVRVENEKVFHGAYEYPNKKMRQPDEKEQINKFLGEILSICLAYGLGPIKSVND